MYNIFWHPHQYLWNQRLTAAIRKLLPVKLLNKPVIGLIVLLDTMLLLLRVVLNRVKSTGLLCLFSKPVLPDNMPVLYLDIGTHREAAELAHMVDNILPSLTSNFSAYGFEANEESFREAESVFTANNKVKLLRYALCDDLPEGKRVKLYHSESGLGDSMYRKSDSFEEVDAIKLSTWIIDNGFKLDTCICLIRMNIEGAETDVVKDLISSGLSKSVAGYYGMWDDLTKIDREQDVIMRTLLSEHNIKKITFNGRDFKFPWRLWCIKYDIHTSIILKLNQAFKV